MLFTYYSQHDAMDCGATCLRMMAKHYGKSYSSQTLREHSGITREDVSLMGISNAAESLDFRTIAIKTEYELAQIAQQEALIGFENPRR